METTHERTLEAREHSLATTFGLPVNANPGVLSASFLAFSGGGHLLGLTVYNSNASTRYVQLHDSQDLPADTTVPRMVWQVPTLSTLTLAFELPGRLFQRGCWVVNSSTDTTKTISGNDLLIDVQYV